MTGWSPPDRHQVVVQSLRQAFWLCKRLADIAVVLAQLMHTHHGACEWTQSIPVAHAATSEHASVDSWTSRWTRGAWVGVNPTDQRRTRMTLAMIPNITGSYTLLTSLGP